MVKQPRKRQKTSKEEKLQPLGSHTSIDDTSKDDEERRLESMLFGVSYVPSEKSKGGTTNDADAALISDEDAVGMPLNELENMLDSDLFFIDDNAGASSNTATTLDETFISFDEGDEAETADQEEAHTQENAATSDAVDAEQDPAASSASGLRSGARKAPAWTDPDDANVQVSLTSNNRLRKLRDAPSEEIVGGREYERRLRRQFERINPTPEWASKARKKLRSSKRRRSSVSGSEPDDDVEDALPDILASTGGISTGKKTGVLTQGVISIERLRDANQAAPAEGEIKSLQFHPSPQIPVLLTASTDRRLRLFHVDGLTNPHAQTLHIPSLPLTNAVFHPSGSSILMTGPRPFYYTYDIQSGTSHRSPRGLWGTTFSSANRDGGMEICAFSPTGDFLAVAGRRGYIHLVDWRSGTAQVITSLKANAAVRSLWWSRTAEGGALMSLTEDSKVYVWDVGQRKCVKRWQDEGGFGSRIMGGDQRGSYLAIGSNTGLVNVYSADSTVTRDASQPKPLKTIGNLTTNISCLRYNHDSQLMAIASNVKKDQLRLIHLPSLTAFSNWPTTSTPLGHVTSMDFSTGSEYLAIGNNRGRVLLYHPREFGQQ
ncbi:WD40-repeat-containing domain protein [Phlebopus sp. FC_14]|nr:WD40-repeat-containing domain protein [Phlebopus sp. FC_14]